MTQNILFPIETINRELDYKLYLACLLAEADRTVHIGQHDAIDKIAPAINGGIYLGKTVFKTHFPTSLKFYKLYKNQKISIIHLDEEGGVYSGDENRWKQILDLRLDPTVLSDPDMLCTWGDFQRDYYTIKADDSFKKHILTTGHPRFDLCRPEYRFYFDEEIKKIKNRFGDYILINGNFSIANNAFGNHITFSTHSGYFVDDTEKRIQFVNRWAYVSHTMTAMVALLHRLAAIYPQTNFIFRGHPGESDTFYQTLFKGVKNVHVIHEGSSFPWVMGAKLLIQNNCTTGIEARLAEVPMINYKPYKHASMDSVIHDDMGLNLETEKEVIAAIEEIMNSGDNSQWYKHHARAAETASLLIQNLKDSDSMSRVMEVMNQQLAQVAEGTGANSLKVNSDAASRFLEDYLKGKARFLFPGKQRTYLAHKKKFYGFNKEYLQKKMNAFSDKHQKKLKLSFIDKYYFQIKRA